MTGKVAFDTRCIDFAPGLLLQILIAADMVGMGMGVIDGRKPPSVCIEQLADFSAGILVISTVDQANIRLVQLDQSDFCGTLYVIIPLGNLNQFVHDDSPPSWVCVGVYEKSG